MADDTKSIKEIRPRDGFIVGLLFGGLGIYIELMSFNVLPQDTMNAPAAIGALSGTVFLFPGLLAIYYAIRNVRGLKNEPGLDIPTWLVTTFIITALSVIGFWIALEGRAEAMSGGVTGSMGEIRIAFAIGGGICGIWSLFLIRSGIRKFLLKKDTPAL